MGVFLAAAMALIAGLMMTRVMNRFKLPDVTAYLVAGVLVGPYFLGRLGIDGIGFVSMEAVGQLDFISDTALGVGDGELVGEQRAGSDALCVGHGELAALGQKAAEAIISLIRQAPLPSLEPLAMGFQTGETA